MSSNKPAFYSSTIRPEFAVAAILCLLAVLFAGAVLYANPNAFVSEWLPFVIFWSVAIGGPLLFLVANISMASRRKRVQAILGYVEQALRLNLPLPPMMLAAAQSETGAARTRLLILHDRLSQGHPLAQSLELSLPEIPRPTLRVVAAADRIGRLPRVLRRLTDRSVRSAQAGSQLDSVYRGYALAVVSTVLVLVAGMICVTIVPKFNAILLPLHVNLPWATQWLSTIADSPVALLAIAALLLLAWISNWAWDWQSSFFPLLSAASRNQALSRLCDFLADALESGRPLTDAVLQAADAQPSASLRRRAQKWAAALTAGQPLQSSARAAGMPALMTGMLATVRNDEDLIHVLSFLSRHYEFRFGRLRELTRAIIAPLLIAVMGAAVFLLALTIFQPMIALIQHYSLPKGGF